MTVVVSKDQTTALVDGRRLEFVPYSVSDTHSFKMCGGLTCAVLSRRGFVGCSVPGRMACVSPYRYDGSSGYWKEAT